MFQHLAGKALQCDAGLRLGTPLAKLAGLASQACVLGCLLLHVVLSAVEQGLAMGLLVSVNIVSLLACDRLIVSLLACDRLIVLSGRRSGRAASSEMRSDIWLCSAM